jgi:hypothetical protein
MKKRVNKKIVLKRETLKSLTDGLTSIAAGSDSVVIGCIPQTQRICPITTTL